MKKKMFRKRQAENLISYETFEEKVEEPKVEIVIEEKPKRRGRPKRVEK